MPFAWIARDGSQMKELDYDVGDTVVHKTQATRGTVAKLYLKLNTVVLELPDGTAKEFAATSMQLETGVSDTKLLDWVLRQELFSCAVSPDSALYAVKTETSKGQGTTPRRAIIAAMANQPTPRPS